MIELIKEQFNTYKPIKELIKEIKSDTVYIYSILEGTQEGRVFVDNIEAIQNIIFWHYCGFAYVAGNSENKSFNEQLGDLLKRGYEENQARFVLAITDDKWKKIIEEQVQGENINCTKRYQFKFDRKLFEERDFTIGDGYEIKEIDTQNIEQIEGRIIPSFSWASNDSFINKGKGVCLVHNGEIACNAFSSAIGNKQMDIGIETNPKYRGKGLGKITAAQMVKRVLELGYEPIWGCHTMNIGSLNIAKAVGFEVIGEHYMYMK